MKIEGGCHCGHISYEAEIDPEAVWICHCTDCQTGSGSAYRTNVQSRKNTFKLLTGQPKTYIKTTAESGNKRAQGFCPECGTPLYSTTVTDPQVYGLRVGTIQSDSTHERTSLASGVAQGSAAAPRMKSTLSNRSMSSPPTLGITVT